MLGCPARGCLGVDEPRAPWCSDCVPGQGHRTPAGADPTPAARAVHAVIDACATSTWRLALPCGGLRPPGAFSSWLACSCVAINGRVPYTTFCAKRTGVHWGRGGGGWVSTKGCAAVAAACRGVCGARDARARVLQAVLYAATLVRHSREGVGYTAVDDMMPPAVLGWRSADGDALVARGASAMLCRAACKFTHTQSCLLIHGRA